jgi:glycerophosphoryl diester phosphodiesterase
VGYPAKPLFLGLQWEKPALPMIFLLIVLTHNSPSVHAADTAPKPAPMSNPSTLVIGHQGAAGLAPGNTLASISLAIDLGVDAIELDVVLSADGTLVVHHDFMLDPERTRNSQGAWLVDSERIPIKAMTVAQLKSYDVGKLKPGTRSARNHPDQDLFDGQSIPTLQEVLEIIKQTGPGGPDLFVEIKTSPEHVDVSPSPQVMADTLVQLVEEHDLFKRCKILSFDWRSLARVHEIAPTISTVYLTSRYKQLKMFDKETTLLWTAGIDPAEYDRSLPDMVKAAGGTSWGAKYSEIWQSHVEKAHEADLTVYVWTVDSESDMRHFVDIGIDGIITNRPDVLKKVVANLK